MHIHTAVTSTPGELELMFVDNSSATPLVQHALRRGRGVPRRTGGPRAPLRGTPRTDFEACASNDAKARPMYADPGYIHGVLLPNLSAGVHYDRVGHCRRSQNHTGPLPRRGASHVAVLYVAGMGVGPQPHGASDSTGA